MNKRKEDRLSTGLIIGLLAPIVGFFIYGLYWTWKFNRSMEYFINDLFIGTPAFRSSILALSLIANLVPFFIFLRKDRFQTARGILIAVFIYVPFVVYFWINS